ncbi:MAG: hypothetical protein CMJ32_01995 [Phycisphaerae bacterium]|nr:hypothetical protein [Phycisphaerae bacterium]
MSELGVTSKPVDSRPVPGWNVLSLAIMILMACLAAWTCRPALIDIWNRASGGDIESGYILFVPFVALYLFWLRKDRIRSIGFAPSLLGPLIVAAGLALSWFGYARDYLVFWHLGALLSIMGSIITMTGLEATRQFGCVFVVLLFLVPVPKIVAAPLTSMMQQVSTLITFQVLELIGINAIQSGNVIEINQARVTIAEVCAGMRMIFPLALVVFAFVFSVPFRLGVRIVLIAVSPLIALICNVLRLIATSIFYGYSTEEMALACHDVGGWVMIPLALLMLLGVVKLIQCLDIPIRSARLVST